MNSRRFYLSIALALAFGAIVVSMNQFQANAEALTTNTAITWTDDFNNASLDGRWSWVREDNSHWSLTNNPDHMRITTQGGSIAGYGFYGPEQNILLTNAPLVNFQITTKLTFSPITYTHMGGILYYQDDDNYLNLLHVYDHGVWMSFHKEVNGNLSYTAYPQQVPTSTLYLRIDKQGTTFTGYFSDDGIDWIQVGQQTITLNNPKIGVAACNGYDGVTEIPADFDFFQLSGVYYNFLPATQR
jgi:beta-xylosidase